MYLREKIRWVIESEKKVVTEGDGKDEETVKNGFQD